MKEYRLYLFIDDKKIRYVDKSTIDCLKCKYVDYIIKNEDNKTIARSYNDVDATSYEKYKIEVFDENVNEKNFISYLRNKRSNYRTVSCLDNSIVMYSNDDLEIVEDLIEKYGDDQVTMYDINDEQILISRLNRFKFNQKASFIIGSGFILTDFVLAGFVLKDPSIIPGVVAGLSTGAGIKFFDISKKSKINMKINERQFKKLTRTRNKNNL